MKQQIIDIKNDGIYTILELEDHTLIPLISVDYLIMNNGLNRNTNIKECIYCHRNNVKLCTLDDMHYFCVDCATKIIEKFAQLGESISLDLNKFNFKLAQKLKDFVEGKIQAKDINLKIINQEKNESQEKEDNQINYGNAGINIKADVIDKQATVIYSEPITKG